MPRCKKNRCCRFLDGERIFKPRATPLDRETMIEVFLDEFEAMRLCDHDGLSQIEAGVRMCVSRATIQRLLSSGRYKLLDALLHSRAIKIHDRMENEQ